jgi:hypothetical protein
MDDNWLLDKDARVQGNSAMLRHGHHSPVRQAIHVRTYIAQKTLMKCLRLNIDSLSVLSEKQPLDKFIILNKTVVKTS